MLHDILLDDIKKYLNGTKKKSIVSSKSKPKKDYWDRICEVREEPERTTEFKKDTNDYWQLQRNQKIIRWDNLLERKFGKDWKQLQRNYKKKMKAICKKKSSIRSNRRITIEIP